MSQSSIMPPDGFASRNFFCLWSSGNHQDEVQRTIIDNHKTYLHTFWQGEHFYIQVESDESKKQFSCYRLLWSLASYPIGMVGYLVDSVAKIVLLVGNLILFLISLASGDPEWFHDRTLILVDNLASIAISLIGIALPPVAYRLDAYVQERMLNRIQKEQPEPHATKEADSASQIPS